MNKLEEQIEAQNEPKYGFQRGAQFVIDLELPVKFAEWLGGNMWQFNGDAWVCYYNPDILSDHKTTGELYKIWIENIYGR